MYVKMFTQKSLILFCLLSLFGCTALIEERVLYPAPPDKSYFEWIGTYTSESDLKNSVFYQLTGEGGESGVFSGVMGLAGNIDGDVIVCDLADQRVKVLDLDNKTIRVFSDYTFGAPLNAAVDRQGQVYITDERSPGVLVFSQEGQLLRTIGDKKVFRKASFVAINDDLGRLYVSDPLNHAIKVFSLTGEFLFEFGQNGEGPGEFHTPQGLEFDSGGQLFVADSMNARVQVFTAEGEFLRQFGERGTFHHQMEVPKDLAFDSEGHLYLTDSRKPSFSVFDPETGGLLIWTGGETASSHKLGFALPTGIFVDDMDRVYIGDLILGRITVWQYLSEAYLQRAQQVKKLK